MPRLIYGIGWLSILCVYTTLLCAETMGMVQEGPHQLERSEQVRFTFPAVPAGQQVHLAWQGRVDHPKQASARFALQVTLNGQEVGAMRDREQTRLLNKPVSFPHRSGRTLYWYAVDTGWRVAYAPDFAASRRLAGHSQDDYGFVLDVTDLCHTDKANELIFRRVPGKRLTVLMLRHIAVTYHALPGIATAAQGSAPLAALSPADDVQPLISAERLGVRMGTRTMQLFTRYALPGGGWTELKGAEESAGQGGALSHADFQVRRTARWEGGRLLVEETVTNRRKDRPVGLRIEQRLSLDGIRVDAVHFGGRPDPALTRLHSPHNPTLYAQSGGSGMGVVLEDNAMRAQHEFVAERGSGHLSWQSDQVALAPHKSYTFRYSIYPLAQGDYYTFINRVRRDWGVPRRLDGPFVLMFNPEKILGMQAHWLAAEIKRLGLKGFGSKVWSLEEGGKGVIGFGVGTRSSLFAAHRERLSRAAALLHKVAPNAPILLYSNMHRHSPKTEDDAKRFADEWMTLANGKHFTKRREGSPPIPGIIPKQDGAFGQAFQATIDTLLKELGFNGIYLDESNGVGGNPWTYNRYDGVSGDLDPKTNDVLATKGSSYLLGLPFRLAFYQWLASQGYFLIANGEPTTMEENRLSFLRMTETNQKPHRAYETHLYTPLVFTVADPPVSDIRQRLMMGTLPFRAAPGAQNSILSYCFPLTIAALGRGYIVGEERVVTAINGAFKPTGPGQHGQLFLFNAKGELTGTPQQVDLATSVQIEVPADGLAVLTVVE